MTKLMQIFKKLKLNKTHLNYSQNITPHLPKTIKLIAKYRRYQQTPPSLPFGQRGGARTFCARSQSPDWERT